MKNNILVYFLINQQGYDKTNAITSKAWDHQ